MTDTLDAHQQELLARMGHLDQHHLADQEQAKILGISAGRLSQLKGTEQYAQVKAEVQQEVTEQQALINGGWAAVEEQSLAVVLQHVKSMQENSLLADPDYALRAATLANKRHVRTAPGNVALDAGASTGKVINLTLSRQFIVNTQQPKEPGPAPAPVVELSGQKVNDVMNINDCQVLLAETGPADPAALDAFQLDIQRG